MGDEHPASASASAEAPDDRGRRRGKGSGAKGRGSRLGRADDDGDWRGAGGDEGRPAQGSGDQKRGGSGQQWTQEEWDQWRASGGWSGHRDGRVSWRESQGHREADEAAEVGATTEGGREGVAARQGRRDGRASRRDSQGRRDADVEPEAGAAADGGAVRQGRRDVHASWRDAQGHREADEAAASGAAAEGGREAAAARQGRRDARASWRDGQGNREADEAVASAAEGRRDHKGRGKGREPVGPRPRGGGATIAGGGERPGRPEWDTSEPAAAPSGAEEGGACGGSKGKGKEPRGSKARGRQGGAREGDGDEDDGAHHHPEEADDGGAGAGRGGKRRKGRGKGADAEPEGKAATTRGANRNSRGRRGVGQEEAGCASPMCGASPKTVTERLTDQLGRGSYDCMICLSRIVRQQPIWQCDKCWCVIHLKCIHQWIKKLSDTGGEERAWTCPNCRYHRVGPLPRYRCFCQKLLEPEANPHWLAHSCGEVCGKDRGCPHPCTELCHPGPCPPCTAVGSSGRCHCGKEERERMRCGDPARWSCGDVCGKLLGCAEHACPLRCHPGPCPPCKVTVAQRCHCGAQEDERLCGLPAFACGGACGKPLSCGNHFCERPCHSGPCGLCPRDPASVEDRCACGSTRNCSGEAAAAMLVRWVGRRTKCSDLLPLCGKVCGKVRETCSHPCKLTCHDGPCGTCEETVEKDCRCGQTRRGVLCSEPGQFLCAQVCKAKKTCGKHRCDVVCCPGFGVRNHENHMCLQVCGKPLPCGKHTCEEFCHLGKCPACRVYRHEPLYCACGESSIAPPVSCGTEPPYCDLICGQELDCGHTCHSRCHFGECPPCRELVTRPCRGGHREMPNQPCHVGPISCGRACGHELPCGHSCAAQCHAGECPPCTQVCNAPRMYCDHACETQCHAGSPCPDAPCKRKIKLACECGLRVTDQVCGAYSGNPRPQLSAPRCDHTCERPSRRPGGGRGTWDSGRPKAPEEPSRFVPDLHNLATQHARYVQMLEDKFFALVAAPAGTPAAAPVVLPPCDATRWLLASEYARLHWKLRTSSRKDTTEGWWKLRIEQTKGMRPPQPLLSELASSSSAKVTTDGHLLPTLDLRPRLYFSGVAGAGDEIYDLVGPEGLMAVRPGQKAGEMFAFFDREAVADKVFRRLTGQAPGADMLPLAAGAGGGSGVRVLLAQTLSGKGAPAPKPVAPPRAAGAPAARGDGWSTEAAEGGAVPVEAEPVLDSWEDAFD